MATYPSQALGIQFVDNNRDGRIDKLVEAPDPAGENIPPVEVRLTNLPPAIVTSYFSNAIYKDGQLSTDALRLKGVAIKPLEKYLYDIRLAHLAQRQKVVNRHAEAYLADGEYKLWAEYITENSIPEADALFYNLLVLAAREASLAGLDLKIVHPDVIQAAKEEARNRLSSVDQATTKREKQQMLDEAFQAAAWVGDSTVYGLTRKDWENIIALDEQITASERDSDLTLAETTIQIIEDNGYVFSRRDKKDPTRKNTHTLFGPQFDLSIETSQTLEDYVSFLGRTQNSSSLLPRILEVLSDIIAVWFHRQISEAMANRKNPSRGNSPIFWEYLMDTANDLPGAVRSRVSGSYLRQYEVDLHAEILNGWAVDLEQARNLDIQMAHQMNNFVWLADAMGNEHEIIELGRRPEDFVDWHKEIAFFEESTGQKAPPHIRKTAEALTNFHSHPW